MTPKEQRFVEEYLVDLNAVAAAKRSGYAAGSAASISYKILKRPKVAAAIAQAQAARAERTRITADAVLRELGKIGFADVRKAVRWQTDDAAQGKAGSSFHILDSAALDDDVAAAIKEVGQDSRGGLKIRLHDKQPALVAIGRHLGMFKDRLEHTGADGGPVAVTRIELVGPIDLPTGFADGREP